MIFLRRKFQAERFRELSSLTCEVKIRFSRAFHTPNDQTHPVPTQISLVNWQRGALIFHNRGESIPMSINFNYSKTRLPESITTDSVQSFDNLSFKIFSFRRESNSRVILRNNGKYSEIFKMEVNEISKRIVAYNRLKINI